MLQAHGDAGISPAEIARRTGMSKRSIYRDLKALETEMQVPLWSDKGKWGVQPRRVPAAAPAVAPGGDGRVPSARLVTRYADKYEPKLASAFEKLGEALPDALRQHVEGTLDDLSSGAWTRTSTARSRTSRRPGRSGGSSRFRVPAGRATTARSASPGPPRSSPYLLEPSLATHALYLIGLDRTRGAMRTFKVERIGDLALTARTFEAPEAGRARGDAPAGVGHHRGPAADRGRAALRPVGGVARREATWHPSQRGRASPDGSLEWRRAVAGTIEIRLWILSWGDEVEVIAPPQLRADVAATHARAASRYGEG